MDKYQIIKCITDLYTRALEKKNESLALRCLSMLCKIEGYFAGKGKQKKLSVPELFAQLETALEERKAAKAAQPLYGEKAVVD